MATAREREEFITLFRDQFPQLDRLGCLIAARILLRHAYTHGQLAVQQCNGPEHLCKPSPFNWRTQPAQHEAWIAQNSADMLAWEAQRERKEQAVEARIREIIKPFPGLAVTFTGDPRGYTVKLHFPTPKFRRSEGNSGICAHCKLKKYEHINAMLCPNAIAPYNTLGGREEGHGVPQ